MNMNSRPYNPEKRAVVAQRSKDTPKSLTAQTIKTIESILSRGDRVEIVPVKDGVRVLHIRRETVEEGK